MDKANLTRKIESHNNIIDQFKRDLKIQKEYHAALQKIERPYLKGQAGNQKNVCDKVQNYQTYDRSSNSNWMENSESELNNFTNENWPINFSSFVPKEIKTSNMTELENEQMNQPTTRDYHLDKGSKFDVRMDLENRSPHVADRLGHPEIFPTPFETLLRLERPLCHPAYLDQPFIQIPSANPDKNLDFTAGEVIYQNPKALEWGRFWAANYVGVLCYIAFYFPYISFGISSSPSMRIRDEVTAPYFDQNWYYYDYYQLFPVIFGAVSYLYLLSGLVNLKGIN